MKWCNVCKQWKEYGDFYKNKRQNDGLGCQCKECDKDQNKKWRIKNPDKVNRKDKKEYNKQYYQTHGIEAKLNRKRYNNENAKYKLYKDKLTIDENTKLNEDGISLEVKCRYCDKYFIPTNLQVGNRMKSLNGKRGDCGLYCSDGCKESCPIFQQKKWPKGFKQATSREVQPELRQLVLLRDDYACVKCNNTEILHCHHILPLNESPITSADMDECITLCKSCHKEVHMNVSGCGYGEMRCSIK